MRTTWLGLGWEARSRCRGDPCGDARCRQAAFSEWNYGDKHIIPSQTPFLAWERRRICCLGSHGSSFLAGLGSVCSGHPTRAPGRNLGKNKEQNLVQHCRKPPGMAVPPQHRVVPSTELPQSSAEAWFSLGSNAGAGGAEIQHTK